MEVITKQYETYTLEELSDAAKKRAHERYIESYEDTWWSEYVIDDAKTVANLMGWHIDHIYYSGFWSQGDGACFVGTMCYAKGCARAVKDYAPQDDMLGSIAQRWQALQRANFYGLRARVMHQGSYSHEMSTVFDVEDTRHNYGWLPESRAKDIEEEVADIARDFMRWVYAQLRDSYEGATSEESFREECDANEWRFTEDGKLFPH